MSRILLTGGSGFVGRALLNHLAPRRPQVICAVRRGAAGRSLPGCVDRIDFELGEADPRWFAGVDAVVHLAAHVHVPWQGTRDEARFESLNGTATRRLAQAAAAAGVRRFVYLSSIGVLGSANRIHDGRPRPFTEQDPPRPFNAYTRSKLSGEQALLDVCAGGGMEYAVIRAPLIFGPGSGGGFRLLLRALAARLPLPLHGCDTRRSLAFVGNVADLLATCVEAPAAANRVFVTADFDVSFEELARRLGAALGTGACLYRCPPSLLRALGMLPVLGPRLRVLTEPLLVDAALLRRTLSWLPPVDPETALADTAHRFAAAH